jgi:hypothetical protein
MTTRELAAERSAGDARIGINPARNNARRGAHPALRTLDGRVVCCIDVAHLIVVWFLVSARKFFIG